MRSAAKKNNDSIHRASQIFFKQSGEPNSFFSSAPALQKQADGDTDFGEETGLTTEHLLQTKSVDGHSMSNNDTAFFNTGPQPIAATYPSVQKKCEGCDKEEDKQKTSTVTKIQRQVFAGATPPDEGEDETNTVVQTQLKIGSVNDSFEQEADAVADKVVMRLSRPSSTISSSNRVIQSKALLQRQSNNEEILQNKGGQSGEVSTDLKQQLDSTNGGQALAPYIQERMEDAFGVEFSDVRIHTNSDSQQLNQDLNARAFTYGTDIHFSAGEYQPHTSGGQHLLAHELTHVVQQNGGLQRKNDNELEKENTGKTPGLQGKLQNATCPLVQRTLSFGPRTRMPSGTLVHNNALPLFAVTNSDLFVEAKIPGANKMDVDTGKFGYADWYRGKPGDRVVGVNFNEDGEPGGINTVGKTNTKRKRRLIFGGGDYDNRKHSAPRKYKAKPKIRDLNQAPTSVEVGDLKPGYSGEMYLGLNQLGSYRAGIANTAVEVNNYLGLSGASAWNVNPSNMTRLSIPSKLTTVNKNGFFYGPLAVYKNGKKKVVFDAGLKGSMVVYKSNVSGIWAYEWVPENIPATTGAGKVDTVLDRLNEDVIDRISSTGKGVASKFKPPKIRRKATSGKRLQRKKKFNYAVWKNKYGQWKKTAKTFLGNKDEKKKGATLEAIVDVNKRTGLGPSVPPKVKKRAKGFDKIKHWQRLGGLYGWLRNTFDGLFVKLKGFADKIKKKVKGLAKSAGSSGFGWIKAAAKALFKVFKMIGSWAVSQAVDKLVASLQEGISKNLSKLVESTTPEGIKSQIEQINELKAKYKTILDEKQADLEKRFFGDKLELFSKLDRFMSIASTVSTIVNVVKWGIRILACASPPLLGCLWNLAISALEYFFSKLMQTCWFSKKAFEWIKEYNISTILNFPATIASYVGTQANKAIPLPDGMEPLFGEIKVNKDDFKIDCGSGGGGGGVGEMTSQQMELLNLVKEIGDKKFEAFLEMMNKRGAGPQVQLTPDRLSELKPLLTKLDAQDMLDLANGKSSTKTVVLEEFLKTVANYTEEEKKAVKARDIEYKKAKKWNPKYQKDLSWKPETFVRPGLTPDSTGFADAVFDIQKLLGFKNPDGMAGPNTTVAYYNKNGLKRDSAFHKANKAVADRKHKIVIARAMAIPYPDKSELIKDLNGVNWHSIGNGGIKFDEVNGHKLIAAMTDNGAKMGGFYKTIPFEHEGKTYPRVIHVRNFINIDKIDKNDSLDFGKINLDKEGMSLTLISFREKPVHSEMDFNELFKGLVVK